MLLLLTAVIVSASLSAAPQTPQADPRLQESDRLFEQAQSLQKEGKIREAIAVAQKAAAIVEGVRGGMHTDTADALANVGQLQFLAKDYAQAVQTFSRTVAIQEKLLPADSTDLAVSLNDLANASRGTGDLAKAVTLLERAIGILRAKLGEDDPSVFATMHNLGDLYADLGDYGRAQPLIERSLALAEKKLGPEDLTVAQFLNNLGAVRVSRGQLQQAEEPYTRSLAIREKLLKPNHPDIARVLGNMGAMYQERAELARAEACYSRALEIYKNSVGENDPLVAGTIHNLAVLRLLQRDPAAAEPLYQRALAIRRAALGATHPTVASSLEAMTIFYWLQGKPAEAARTQREANEIQDQNLANILAVGSEQQKLLFMNTLRETTDITITLRSALATGEIDALAATTVLRRKGRVLDTMVDTLAAVSRGASDADRALLARLSAVRADQAGLALRPPSDINPAERQRRIDALDKEAQGLESELSRNTATLRAESRTLTLAEVTERIPRDTALVEYVQYRAFDPHVVGHTGRFGVSRYAALVLRHGSSVPTWIELGDADRIDRAVSAWRAALSRPERTDVQALGRELDALVLEPAIRSLPATERLLIAPDGALALVPFAALVGPKDEYRINAFEIVLLSSARDVLRLGSHGSSPTPALVLADPAYDGTSKTPPTGFTRLPGTAEEARALARLMPHATVLTGLDATEGRLKAAQSPAILHIATHGFFAGGGGSGTAQTRGLKSAAPTSPAAGENLIDALARSGLALAGANTQPSGAADDGLLTAVEAASLNLSGTQLVVLSACETGVGEVRTGEGVQGLRRALTMAGAGSQVMSLWQVNDRATRELMVDYYTALLAGKGRGAALRDVQLAMQRRAARAHPFYWAAFIFAGDWQPLQDLSSIR